MRVLPQEQMWKTHTMGHFDKLKLKSQEFLINQILNFISMSTKKNLIKLSILFEKIAGSEGSKRHARRLKWLFESNHPHLDWWQKIIRDLHPNCRNKWIMNFFVHGYYGDNQRKRTSFNKENGFFPPTVLLASITKNCNFNCAGCWAHDYDVREDLSYEKWKEIFTEARDKMGIHMIPVVGGEPFARPDFLKLAEEFSDCAFITFTNASLLTDEKIKQLQKLGNVHPMVSLGGLKENNDAIRGEGCFDMVMEKMDKLKKAGIFFGVSVTATRGNTDEITSDKFIKMLSDKGSLWTRFFHYVPVGESPNVDLIPTADQRNQIKKAVYNARNTLPMFTVDFWGDGPEMMGCIAGGRQYIHVNPKGDVEPCTFVHLATHNVNNCTLTEALASPFMTAIRNNIPYDGNMLRPCMIVDHPEVLRKYYEEFKPYETHKGAADYLTKPEIIRKIDEYSCNVKEIMDKEWENDFYMTIFPLEGEYYHDREILCSSKIPQGGVHGGCEKAGFCNCGKDLSAIKNNGRNVAPTL
ncbi:MAG: radical SAM protein [Candidatus Gastranaerophilaceae bacterium]|jgi:MoaA/NifB/PqqE/SkfB family radical SAM enzyme